MPSTATIIAALFLLAIACLISAAALAAGGGRPAAEAQALPGRDVLGRAGVQVELPDRVKLPELPVRPGRVRPDGLAEAPLTAPQAVRAVIEAGNQIASAPYVYGGGHNAAFAGPGYDCSGSVSYALRGAGLVGLPMSSSGFFGWGLPGPGRWITIYTAPGHMFMVVAGMRFDTSGRAQRGTRWAASGRPLAGYVARHPAGL